MSDDNKKLDADKSIEAEEKSKTNKKPSAATKKVKVKSSEDSSGSGEKKKIIEKLQAMGVMSGGQKGESGINNSKRGSLSIIFTASAIVVVVVSVFVWTLNNKAVQEQSASNINADEKSNHQISQSTYINPWQPYPDNLYNKNTNNYSGAYYPTQVENHDDYEKQREKWIQEQKKSQEQERLQYQKWVKEQQQQYEQYMKWIQQQHAQQQLQQQNWADTYQMYNGYQGQAVPQSYNYVPQYQQPQQYYSR